MSSSPEAPRRTAKRALAVSAVVVAVVTAGALCWLAGRQSPAGGEAPGADSVDVGFLRDMADHHDQAVQMALILLRNSEDAVLRGFAVDTVASQRYEIGLMDARLQDWKAGRGAIDRRAMAWMHAGMPVAAMPGMASTAELAELARLRGPDGDRLFIRLMTAHHEGGIHMATYAMEHAEDAAVRQLAERIAKAQRLEIRDLELARLRVGSAPS